MCVILCLFLFGSNSYRGKMAAEKGDPKAQYKLAWIYYDGNANVAVDKSKAVELFSKSAIQGYSKAQSMLGYCYEQGIGSVKDLERAVFGIPRLRNRTMQALKIIWHFVI